MIYPLYQLIVRELLKIWKFENGLWEIYSKNENEPPGVPVCGKTSLIWRGDGGPGI